ncbi:sigma-54-dependent Fis family transcriptional regulator [Aquabacterium lacunae]|uniref:Sigma-54-dependent Fis family transcriptional regulator n=1 Tax=Aquabacterium lacunae TaxID=2528630 RepID=A0A4Q9H3S8_9BURK|nr:sigma-54-dependent Fis family transcriptional regulator [Aquabacterium lacunae]TBO34211.1 sigma-54-dependent Fis family transcriptional regulator [Aquabacterium lacunae]
MHLIQPNRFDQLREARRGLLEDGVVPAGLVDDVVSRSWTRSQMAGLSPTEPPMAPPVSSGAELRRALAREYDFLSHARPVMEFLFDQMRDSGAMVILADAQGMLLHSLGDAEFLQRAERVSLCPGALWREEYRGTNAIGTCIVDQTPTVIQGGEHYLERNGFLTCAAAPVMAPDGHLKGVLDISGDQRGYHPHTFALVRSATRMIEDRLFHARHANDQLLRLHPHVEGLGGVGEGLLAVTEDGWVMGANAVAQQWLSLSASQIGAVTLDRLLGPQAQRLLNLPATGTPTRVTTMNGQTLFARDEPDRRRRIWAVANAAETDDRGAAGRPGGSTATALPVRPVRSHRPKDDVRLSKALARALRVQAQGIPVLLQGESGTGKEVFSRQLHREGDRGNKPFVAVNCAALPETLIEAELFGYVGGAFTGARREGSPGRIRQAEGGTLFLDEIGDMPLALQARLLRVLQDKCVVPVGGCHPVPVDFVLVCATHRNLREAVAQGEFREDLFWRINGLTVQLPALRERGDMVELIDDMLHSLAHDMKRHEVPSLADEVLQALQQHPWPGNLRQLHAVLRTACALLGPHDSELHWEHFGEDLWDDVFSRPIRADDALDDRLAAQARQQAALTAAPGPESAPETNLRRLSNSAIERAIRDSDGNMTQAARLLGISRNTLYRRIKQMSTH